MVSMDWIWITLVVISVIALLTRFVMKKNIRKSLPPGPRGLPILGHLHMLGKNPHQSLYKLSKKHGPIMYMKFGFVPTIIVSSPQAAKQFLKTHDLVFAGRPPHEGAKIVSYGQRSMAFSPYGLYWRNIRKLCTEHLLNNFKINSFKPMRREEVGIFVEALKHDAQNRVVVDLSAKVSSLILDLSCRMIFGKKYADKDIDEKGFIAIIHEGMQLLGTPNLADYIPYLGALDIQGLTRKLKVIRRVLDEFLEMVIDEHEQSKNQEKTKDFVDTMLDIMKSGEAEFQLDRNDVKTVLLDMLVGSMDTSATFIEWTLSELLRNPQIMQKVQKELEDKIGMNKKVEEADLDKLAYLNMVVKETMRLHSSLLLPHESMKDCTIDGYHIQKKSTILANLYSIGRDPKAWTDPETFIPERFVRSDIDVWGRDFRLIPFGSGRRSCPGMQLGFIVVRLVVAQLVYSFDWELPYGMLPTELDMTEEFGAALIKANHLMAIPTYRLHG